MIGAIFATDPLGGFGFENKMPWHFPEDFKHFKFMTYGSKIVMGRNTFESLPGILPGREHIVLSSTLPPGPKHKVYANIDDLFEFEGNNFWVIGGPGVIKAVHEAVGLDVVYHTKIPGEYETDVKFNVSCLTGLSMSDVQEREKFSIYKYVNPNKF